MTSKMAGEYLGGFTVAKLARLRERGGGPRYTRFGGGWPVYRREDLDEWFAASLRGEAHRVSPPRAPKIHGGSAPVREAPKGLSVSAAAVYLGHDDSGLLIRLRKAGLGPQYFREHSRGWIRYRVEDLDSWRESDRALERGPDVKSAGAQAVPEPGASPRTPTSPITPEEAAAYLGVTVGTLTNWRYRGVGPSYVRFGGPRSRVRYRQADLDAWIESRRIE